MKSYKPHLLKKVMGDLRKVPLGSHGHEPPAKHPGAATVQITIAHGGKPEPMGDEPDQEGLEPAELEASEDGMSDPFGKLKSKHKFGK
jgi:hypothetical protein